MIVLRVRELRESGSYVNEAVAEISIRRWIIPIVSSMAFEPVWTEVLDTLIGQLERLYISCIADTHVTLVVVRDVNRGRAGNRRG